MVEIVLLPLPIFGFFNPLFPRCIGGFLCFLENFWFVPSSLTISRYIAPSRRGYDALHFISLSSLAFRPSMASGKASRLSLGCLRGSYLASEPFYGYIAVSCRLSADCGLWARCRACHRLSTVFRGFLYCVVFAMLDRSIFVFWLMMFC